MGEVVQKLFVLANRDFMAVERESRDIDFLAIDQDLARGNLNLLPVQGGVHIEKKPVMEDENPKKGETHESQGTNGDGPPTEKAGANRLAGGFDFLLPDVNLLHVGKLAFEFPGAPEKVERRGSGIAENLEEFLAFWGIREKWFEEGCELGGVFQKRGFGGSGKCGGVPQPGGPLGGKSVVMGTEQAGGDGGGLHLGKHRAQGGGQAGARKEIEFLRGALKVQQGGVGDRFHRDENPLFHLNGFVE